jgi:uncharacterized repeat protein (TIGR03803 family)
MRRFVTNVAVSTLIVLTLTIVSAQSVRAQTFTAIHNFTGADGATPVAGLTMDKAGNLYGTTTYGGTSECDQGALGCGTVFKLAHSASKWTLTPLYDFTGKAHNNDGEFPFAGVVFGPDGYLYGTTTDGGGGQCRSVDGGCGTVFMLRPPPKACKTALCPWNETILYSFAGGNDGWYPIGDLFFDHMGNIYGTTESGGGAGCGGYGDGCGTVFKLTPSNGEWTESVIYSFTGGQDGAVPQAGLVMDSADNLYGTALQGGSGCGFYGCGTVFQLTLSDSGWRENTIYAFQRANGGPTTGVIFDQSGNLYGVTNTVFELIPSGVNWSYTPIFDLGGGMLRGNLAEDKASNLYGTTNDGGVYGLGTVFKLTPSSGSWKYIDLHDFTGGSDGGQPYGSVLVDATGNLYGTASRGGDPLQYCGGNGCGVVWEITP